MNSGGLACLGSPFFDWIVVEIMCPVTETSPTCTDDICRKHYILSYYATIRCNTREKRMKCERINAKNPTNIPKLERGWNQCKREKQITEGSFKQNECTFSKGSKRIVDLNKQQKFPLRSQIKEAMNSVGEARPLSYTTFPKQTSQDWESTWNSFAMKDDLT